MMDLPSLKTAHLKDKRVFVRIDVDIPLKNKHIVDDSRLKAELSTIQYLLEKGAEIILAGHLGRPSGVDPKYSLEPVALWLCHRIKNHEPARNASQSVAGGSRIKYEKVGQFWGWRIAPKLFLLENLRFYEEEEKNDPKFAKQLADLADIYVNESFATSHRKHASVVGVPQFLPHFAGFNLQKEIETLEGILQNPQRPLVVVVGGAKIETKLPVVTKMHEIADFVLVGGKIAQHQRELLHEQHRSIKSRKSVLQVADLNEEQADITPESTENFLQILSLAKTTVWNGPVGYIDSDNPYDEEGTKKLAEGIVKSSAFKVVGGGDTVGFLKKIGLLSKFDFVSMGGGAMLDFLAGEKLPGIEALMH